MTPREAPGRSGLGDLEPGTGQRAQLCILALESPARLVRGRRQRLCLFLPEVRGRGYAAEACAAALGLSADPLPGEPVVLCTRTANDRSMRLAAKPGFTEVQRFG
ncbi:acetyltransferase (GNAT) family protein [Streptomyces sp. SLBN-115]|nr:acetyltransferase (GNAT) family protein [Streptomyces sp. SLBN-115]